MGLSVQEWDDLPWWQAELYLDGLLEEYGSADDGSVEFDDPVGLDDIGIVVRTAPAAGG